MKACFFELGAEGCLDTQPSATSFLQTWSISPNVGKAALQEHSSAPASLHVYPSANRKKPKRDMVLQPRGAWQLLEFLFLLVFI